MVWVTTDYTYINTGGTTYYFAPNELVYDGQPLGRRNQILQESESGEIKIQQLDTNNRLFYSFKIRHMPADNRTISGVTVYGFDALRTLITSTMNYRETAVTFKPTGIIAANQFSARYWSSEFPAVPIARMDSGGLEYYGDRSSVLTFRREI